MHQLAFRINQNGGKAKLAYSGPHSRLSIDGNVMRGNGATSPMLSHFVHYQPQALNEIQCGPGTFLIYPEIATDLAAAPQIGDAPRAIWWLSVDNALLKNPQLADAAYRRSLFSDPKLIHFCQSAYAHEFLKNTGIACAPPFRLHRSAIYQTQPNTICQSADCPTR